MNDEWTDPRLWAGRLLFAAGLVVGCEPAPKPECQAVDFAQPCWLKARDSACHLWMDPATKLEGSWLSYHGDCVDGKAHGHGLSEFYPGPKVAGSYIHEGGFAAGRAHGPGTEMQPNDKRFEGEWEFGEFRRGTVIYKPGGRVSSYTGEWQNGHFDGKGTLRYPDGGALVGTFGSGFADHGTRKWPDGREYTGDFFMGHLTGDGTMRYPNGGQYEGEWARDFHHGEGVMTYADGGRYEGGWRVNKYDGTGVRTWLDGSKYDGDWKMGKRSGSLGTMTYRDGSVYFGEWLDDNRHGRGKLTRPDGSVQRFGWWENDRFKKSF